MISTRFAAPTFVLTSLALVPTVLHTYMNDKLRAETRLEQLAVQVDTDSGQQTERTTEWALRKFDTDDWMQRAYFNGEVVLTIVRTYDPKRIYHHPELAVAYPDDYLPEHVLRVPARSTVPVHVLTGQNDSADRRSMYVLEYDGTYVVDPLRFQLRSAFQSLFSARKPMTLIYVHERAHARRDDAQTSRGARVLVAALDEMARTSSPAANH